MNVVADKFVTIFIYLFILKVVRIKIRVMTLRANILIRG